MAVHPEEPISVQDWRGLPYCQVDNRLMRSTALDPYAKLVYVILCGYANIHTVDCNPSIKTLCADLGISKPTVLRAIKCLCEHGVLQVTNRHDSLGRDQSHHYAIKDWREAEAGRVKDVDTRVSQIDARVKDVDGEGKGRLPGRVKDVDTKEIDLERDRSKEINQVSQDAIAPEPPPQKPANKSSLKAKDDSDPRTNQVMNAIQEACGKPILHWAKHASEVKKMLRAGYEPDDIVNCWKAKRAIDKGWVQLALVAEIIGDFVTNGGKLPQRGNGSGQYAKQTGRSRTPRTDDSDPYAGLDNTDMARP